MFDCSPTRGNNCFPDPFRDGAWIQSQVLPSVGSRRLFPVRFTHIGNFREKLLEPDKTENNFCFIPASCRLWRHTPAVRIRTKAKQLAFSPPQEYKNTPYVVCFCILVAGPGFEPGSRGYEPLEVPLLYPALLLNCLDVYVQPI